MDVPFAHANIGNYQGFKRYYRKSTTLNLLAGVVEPQCYMVCLLE